MNLARAYNILGIDETVDEAILKMAYRQTATDNHRKLQDSEISEKLLKDINIARDFVLDTLQGEEKTDIHQGSQRPSPEDSFNSTETKVMSALRKGEYNYFEKKEALKFNSSVEEHFDTLHEFQKYDAGFGKILLHLISKHRDNKKIVEASLNIFQKLEYSESSIFNTIKLFTDTPEYQKILIMKLSESSENSMLVAQALEYIKDTESQKLCIQHINEITPVNTNIVFEALKWIDNISLQEELIDIFENGTRNNLPLLLKIFPSIKDEGNKGKIFHIFNSYSLIDEKDIKILLKAFDVFHEEKYREVLGQRINATNIEELFVSYGSIKSPDTRKSMIELQLGSINTGEGFINIIKNIESDFFDDKNLVSLFGESLHTKISESELRFFYDNFQPRNIGTGSIFLGLLIKNGKNLENIKSGKAFYTAEKNLLLQKTGELKTQLSSYPIKNSSSTKEKDLYAIMAELSTDKNNKDHETLEGKRKELLRDILNEKKSFPIHEKIKKIYQEIEGVEKQIQLFQKEFNKVALYIHALKKNI